MSGRPGWWKGARGEWWVAAQFVLLAVILFAPPRWRWQAEQRAIWGALGAVLIASGLGIAAKAMRDMGPSLSPFPKPRRRAELVQRGAFARVRHPTYAGAILAAFGWALWRASGLHLLLALALAILFDRKAQREESFLLERFPGYAAYRARTKRLIPWIY